MTKTLADMTAEERANCVGRWADAMGQGLGVIVNATELSDCWVLFPEDGGSVATCRNQRVTPRFDLPRAWTPDGEPELAQALAEETYEYQIQTRSQRMPTWLAIADNTLQKWYSEDGYNEIIREGRVFRGGAGFEMRVLRRRVSPPEVINE